VNTLQQVILTLQYSVETFEQACQCGPCDPCTKGQGDLAYRNPGVEFPSVRIWLSLGFLVDGLALLPMGGFLKPKCNIGQFKKSIASRD